MLTRILLPMYTVTIMNTKKSNKSMKPQKLD